MIEVGPTFRTVRSDDPVAAGLLADYVDELVGYGVILDEHASGAVGAEEMVPPRGDFQVASLGGRPVACGGMRVAGSGAGPRVAEVKRMYVDPAARGHGVARALLARLEDSARAAGCTTVRLDTGAGMDPAVRLYLSSGYTEIADYNGNPEAGHWFEKPL